HHRREAGRLRAGPAGRAPRRGAGAPERARALLVRDQRGALGPDQGRAPIALPAARGEARHGDRARARSSLRPRLRPGRHRLLRGARALRRRPREVGGPLPSGPHGGPAPHGAAGGPGPHPDQARAARRGPARAAGGARREGAAQRGGLDREGREGGPRAARHPARRLVKIGHAIRRLRREAPSWRVTALAQVAAQWHDPFRVLIACLLSLRTKDETTGPAAARLFALADTPEALRRLSPRTIERAIYPVGFYRTKARVLREVSRDLIERFGGRVPDDIDALLTLKGVGRKTANLVVTQGFNKPGICVDVHVHRISNRLGYVTTRTPEETEAALRRRL